MEIEEKRAIADTRSDIYSFGVVLFEMLTGEPPFQGERVRDLYVHHLRTKPRNPSDLEPGIDHRLDALVLRCLEKNPARRFRSFGDLKNELMELHLESTGTPFELPEIGEEIGTWYWIGKGKAFVSLGQHTNTITCMDKALEIDPDDITALCLKGKALHMRGDVHDALRSFEMALKLDPDNVEVLNEKGSTLFSIHKFKPASSELPVLWLCGL